MDLVQFASAMGLLFHNRSSMPDDGVRFLRFTLRNMWGGKIIIAIVKIYGLLHTYLVRWPRFAVY